MAHVRVTSRAGTYRQQPTGYTAFIPNPLPPAPPPRLDDELLELLSRADRALGRLDGATETLPNPDLFVFTYVRKEAVLSSQIEGTQASLLDVFEFESHLKDPSSSTDAGDVINYIAAMNHGLERLQTLPLSLRLLREIHGKLLAGVRGSHYQPGEFRTTQNWIGPPGSQLSGATFVPPPPSELLQSLGDLETFLHDRSPMPVLIKVGLAHAQFETIHPFLDGNGRVGRLLITLLLCERQILQRPLLYLSHYFKAHRSEYYERLQAVRDHGQWEEWLKFFLQGVFEIAQQAVSTAHQIVNLRERNRKLVIDHLGRGAGNALLLLERLFFEPVVSVESVRKITGLSYAGANKLVLKLERLELLREITGRVRSRAFGYQPYLDLIS